MGKAAIAYIVGLSVIIGMVLFNVNRTSLDSMDTYTTYFGRTMAHNIALAAANTGANRVLFTPGYNTPFSGTFADGSYEVTFADTGFSDDYHKFMTATAAYVSGGETIRDTVSAVFGRISFSRYAWFTEEEKNGYLRPNGAAGPFFGASDWKITGDSIYGYAHTNSKFNLAGTPYFQKKVTAANAATLMPLFGVSAPVYDEGYQWGISISRPAANITDLKAIANTGSPLGGLMNGNDVGMEFFADGTVRVKIPFDTGGLADTTLPVSSLSSSKVFGAFAGDLHIKGTYAGQMTVVAFKGVGATAKKGNVWFDGDLVAASNPATTPGSTDKFGVVAERMGYLTKDVARTAATTVSIQAAIYVHEGEFTAEDFWSIPISGRVNLYGALTQKTAGSLGVFNPGVGLLNGFFYSIRHDSRFLVNGPPSFPFSPKYRLVAWWEN